MTTFVLLVLTLTVLRHVGVVRVRHDGTLRLPVHVSSWGWWVACWQFGPRVQVFRNVIKWERGRLLPRRWGGAILGLEIGDRG